MDVVEGAVSSGLSPLLALLAICALVFLAGRAAVELLTFPGGAGEPAPIRSPNFVAIGGCAFPVLLLAWGLRGVGLHSFWGMIGGLATIITCAALLRRNFRQPLLHPLRQFDILFVAYIASVLLFFLLLRPYEYPLKETPAYFTPDFDLFMPGADPAAAPYFGSIILQPVLYARHTILAMFNVFSYPSHFFYFAEGTYWLSALIGPAIPIGAYILFRRYVSAWLALAVAILFCSIALDYKVWLLRAESVAWIIGLACLIVQVDLQAVFRKQGINAASVGAAVLLALLYFTLFFSDGMVALIVTILSVGLAAVFIYRLPRQTQPRYLWEPFVVIGLCAVLTVGLATSFARSYSSCAALIDECQHSSIDGPVASSGVAIPPEKADRGPLLDQLIPTSQPPPPYVWTGKTGEITIFLAHAAPFIPNIASIGLLEFPSLMVDKLQSLSLLQMVVPAAVFLLCCFLHVRYAGRLSEGHQSIFWVIVGSYVLLIVFSLVLDRLSVGMLPLVIVRRTILYAAFFYWTVIGLTVAVFVVAPPGRRLRSIFAESRTKPIETLTLLQLSFLLLWLPWKILSEGLRVEAVVQRRLLKGVEEVACKSVAEVTLRQVALLLLFSPFRWIAVRKSAQLPRVSDSRRWEQVAVVCLIPAWFLYSINSTFHRPIGPAWIAERLGHCVQHRCNSDPIFFPRTALRQLFDAMAFVRANSEPGDWVYSNVISESRFRFLSLGRASLLDGELAGVPNSEHEAAAARVENFAHFARTADPKYLGRTDIKLLVLYKRADCRSPACYGSQLVPTDLSAFSGRLDLNKVMENDDYVIYQRSIALRSSGTSAVLGRIPRGADLGR